MTVTEIETAGRGFPLRGRSHTPSALVGRDPDMTVIREFVAELPAQGGTLLLTGEPGVGKSALLHAAAELAATAGLRVLRAAGAEFEDESFSGLNQLLLPLRGEVNRLDGLHRTALNAALGFGDGPARERLVVSSAVLALLSRVAADGPLLLIVDNLPWLDQASAGVLGFVARRLAGSGVGLLAAQRPVSPGPFDRDVPRHEVPPLDDVAAIRLVSAHGPDVAPSVRRRIVAQAQGNALALVELPLALSDQQRAGRATLPAVLPLSPRLRAQWSPLVAALPATSRDLMLLAVLEGTGSLSLLRAAAAGQYDVADLAAAEHAGLVHVDEAAGQLNFAHPLIRSAVLDLPTGNQVRRAHRALAAQLGDQPERRAWHLAEAATGPDEAVAGQLEQSARRVRDSGDAGQAVTVLLRAAQLSPRDRVPGRLLAEAAYLSATATGELPLAARLLTDARRAGPGGARAAETALHTAVADACLQLNGAGDIDTVQSDGPWADAVARHTAAIAAARKLGDRPGQANALTDRGAVRQLTGDHLAAARDLEEALGICRDLGDRLGQASALNHLGAVRRLTGDSPAAVRDLEEALGICRDLGDRPGEASALSFLGTARRLTGDYPAAAHDLEAAIGLYRDLGDRGGEAEVLNERGTLYRVSGRLAQAESCHQQSLELAHAIASVGRGARAGGPGPLRPGRRRRDAGREPAAAGPGDFPADRRGRNRRGSGRAGNASRPVTRTARHRRGPAL